MLSSGAATVLVVMLLSAIALVASIFGFVATGVLGMDWSLRTGLADAVVAVAIYLVCAVALALFQPKERVTLVASAVAAVLGGGVLRHVGRRVLRSTPGAPAP
jgi:lipoprotein signal peptidase